MSKNTGEEHIVCRVCDATLKIPKTQQTLKITCPNCASVFFHPRPKKPWVDRKSLIWGG